MDAKGLRIRKALALYFVGERFIGDPYWQNEARRTEGLCAMECEHGGFCVRLIHKDPVHSTGGCVWVEV